MRIFSGSARTPTLFLMDGCLRLLSARDGLQHHRDAQDNPIPYQGPGLDPRRDRSSFVLIPSDGPS